MESAYDEGGKVKSSHLVIFLALTAIVGLFKLSSPAAQKVNQPNVQKAPAKADNKNTENPTSAGPEKKPQIVRWQDWEEIEVRFRTLGVNELKKQIQKIDMRLLNFSGQNFSDMKPDELRAFNQLNRMRAVALQQLIMIKHGDLL